MARPSVPLRGLWNDHRPSSSDALRAGTKGVLAAEVRLEGPDCDVTCLEKTWIPLATRLESVLPVHTCPKALGTRARQKELYGTLLPQ
jgi:hypothetical protein